MKNKLEKKENVSVSTFKSIICPDIFLEMFSENVRMVLQLNTRRTTHFQKANYQLIMSEHISRIYSP